VELNGRELSWDGCVNVRGLGGLGQIRPAALVRMEAPRRLSEAGWAAVWAYGVRTIVDLRGADEGDPDLAPRPAGITTVQVPLDPGCVVFHCAGGKDRTGLLALVLLTLAGAAPEEIIADYLLG
jgi:protein-tyrosine phosphatase